MLTNTAFSHSNEECSPYFLVITHQTQARDDIDGLMQERRNSIANALDHVFLATSHPYKECHLWVTPPPSPLYYFLQCNEINMTMHWIIIFWFYHWSMYWAYSITLYCTATYREYATVKFVIPNHLHHSQYLLSGVPDFFDRNKILSGGDLSHYQVPHCIRVFFYFVWFVFIHHNFQFYFELCTYCSILDIYLS